MTAAPAEDIRYVATACVRADTSAPSAARTFVADTLHSWHLAHLVDDARIIMSELATNVARYAGRSEADTSMRLCVCLNSSLLLGVIDPFPVEDGLLAGNGDAPGGVHENGRGLLIVRSLSDRFGVQRLVPAGKLVWCELNPLASTGAYLSGRTRHPRRCPHRRAFLATPAPRLAGGSAQK